MSCKTLKFQKLFSYDIRIMSFYTTINYYNFFLIFTYCSFFNYEFKDRL